MVVIIAQQVHECRIARTGIDRSSFIFDRKPGISLADGAFRVAVYVDNHLVAGHTIKEVQSIAASIASDLDSGGLQTHDSFDDVERDFVGLQFSCRGEGERVLLVSNLYF